MFNKEQWLDHLMHATPVEGYGNRMSMFLISLEAWRRGIDVKYYTLDNPENKLLVRYALTYNGRTIRFNSSLSYQLSEATYNLCQDKDQTKKRLAECGIRVPKGEKLSKDTELDDLAKLANALTYPVVMKPVSENAGQGVFSNITDEQMLFDVFAYLTEELKYDEVILEEFIPGEEHRILTVGNKVVGVVKRVPANIVGNGKDTIKKLIREKNKSKQFNPVISKKTIDIDKEVQNQLTKAGYELDDILEEGKRLYLRSKSNISTGGDPIDVMDEIDPSVIEMSKKATEAIPGLELAGIDMMIDPETNEKAIIEVNTRPMIGLHVFPTEGKPRDVVKDIVDFYFPETKDIERSRLYFDFGKVTSSLDGVVTKEVVLQSIIPKPYFAKRYLISIEEKRQQFRRDIRRNALIEGLSGYAKNAGQNYIEVILAHPIETKVNSFFATYYQDSNYTFDIEEEEVWQYPVSIGFTTATHSDNIVLAEKMIKDSNEKIKKLNKTHQAEKAQMIQQLDEERSQVSIYKKAFIKIERQKNTLKVNQKKQKTMLNKQKQEIEKLKEELNRKWYRRLIKSKRIQ